VCPGPAPHRQGAAVEQALGKPFHAGILTAHLPAIEGLEVIIPGCAVTQADAVAGGEELRELEELRDVPGVGALHLVEGFEFGVFDGWAGDPYPFAPANAGSGLPTCENAAETLRRNRLSRVTKPATSAHVPLF
jgi:hypothetical protein